MSGYFAPPARASSRCRSARRQSASLTAFFPTRTTPASPGSPFLPPVFGIFLRQRLPEGLRLFPFPLLLERPRKQGEERRSGRHVGVRRERPPGPRLGAVVPFPGEEVVHHGRLVQGQPVAQITDLPGGLLRAPGAWLPFQEQRVHLDRLQRLPLVPPWRQGLPGEQGALQEQGVGDLRVRGVEAQEVVERHLRL